MATQTQRVPLEGSHRLAIRGSRRLGAVHPDEQIEVTLRLRPARKSPPRFTRQRRSPSPTRIAAT